MDEQITTLEDELARVQAELEVERQQQSLENWLSYVTWYRKSTMTWSMTGANVKIYIAILKMQFSRRWVFLVLLYFLDFLIWYYFAGLQKIIEELWAENFQQWELLTNVSES